MRRGKSWDEWYLDLCKEVSTKSQCHSRQIGAILVKDKSVVAQGYNGPPRGIMPCDERWLVDDKMKAGAGLQKFDEKFYKENLEGICPRYIPEFGFKSGEGLEWCVAGHAERNVLNNAARHGISTNFGTMYMDCGIPCTPCLVEIINSGIREIVVTSFETYDISADYLLRHSELRLRMYKHLCPHEDQKKQMNLPISILDGRCSDCGAEI